MNYGQTIIPLCKRIKFTQFKIKYYDLYLIFKRFNNDFSSSSFRSWIQKILNIEFESFSRSPNWEAEAFIQLVLKYTKKLIALYDHIIVSEYIWVNMFTKKEVKLLDYYQKYDQPLIEKVIEGC
uniref:Uncharacterized protein n=1 Tax=Rhipiliopsis peltata TaxID=2320810 RepID=A0A386B1C6_9CHLO|nr:hypothetical protein [Rhipiliopsis peltata]AYC65501.1 hypothetical protein [Rhipiliopsis peltata]